MAAKRMDQLSTLSTVADSDLLLLYDVDEGGSEKTKSITYAEFETQISGAVGGGSDTHEPEALYHSGQKRLEGTSTSNGGIIVYNENNKDTFYIYDVNNQIVIAPYGSGMASDYDLKLNVYKHGTGNQNGIVLNGGGAAELYYAGVKTLETDTGGINIYDSDASDYLELTHNGSHVSLVNTTNSGQMYLKITNSGAVVKTGLRIDPNGTLEGYYQGSQAWLTTANGLILYGPATGDTTIRTYNGYMQIYNAQHGAQIRLVAEDAGGGNKSLFIGDPDGAAELYYAGSKVMETISDGIYINSVMPVTHDGTNAFIRNETHGGSIYLQAEDGAGTRRTLFQGSPDGASKIYHDSYPRLETSTIGDGGIMVKSDSGQQFDMYWSADVFYIDNNVDSSHIQIRGENAASVNTTMANFDPDGAAELYYAGVKKFETTADGVTITDGRIEGNLLVAGNLTVSGTTFTTQTETVQISDNLLVINHGEVSTGVTEGEAGIEVDRGQAVNYRFMFDETDDYFVVGISGSEQPVATREDSPTQGYVPYWDASNYQFVNTDSPIKRTTDSGVELYYNGTKQFETTSAGVKMSSTTPTLQLDSSGAGGAKTIQFTSANAGKWALGHNAGGDENFHLYSLAAGTYPLTVVHTGALDNTLVLNAGKVGVGVSPTAALHVQSSSKDILKGIDSGAVELYYNGTKTLSTTAVGIIVGDAGTQIDIYNLNTLTYFHSQVNGNSIALVGKNNSGVDKYVFKGDPDGAVELYYDGTKTVETTDEGIEVIGGVKFPATQNASSDVNTLDDYDEYTAANTACTGALTVSAIWKLVKVGNLVTLTLPAVNGTTSNVAAITFGVSIPTKYRPTASIAGAAHVWVNGAGLAGLGVVTITTGGVISVYRDGTQSLGWGTAANSGMLTGVSVSWVI